MANKHATERNVERKALARCNSCGRNTINGALCAACETRMNELEAELNAHWQGIEEEWNGETYEY